ncbi:MAG TPA: efflux transporter outer membrane subunit [Steroidobacteraceae bacterium]|nr:efflux transporter outer membrane subunit [Steroidobacteraceae bacterium]
MKSPVLHGPVPSAARRVGMLLTAALAAGCAVGPDYQGPPALPAADGSFPVPARVASGMPADRWWEELKDPELARLIARALADNPDLASAEARVQQSRAAARVAGAAFYPAVNATADVSRDRLSRNGENLALIPSLFTPPTTEFTDYRAGLDASWEIDLAGKTRREVEAAVARLGSSEATRADARAVVAAGVANAYVDYRDSSLRLGPARDAASAARETAQLTGLQQQAGVASESDRARAEADSQAAEAAVPPLESAQQSALYQLAALVDTPVSDLRTQLGADAPLPAPPAEAPAGLAADILKRRPDILHAERELAAATADVGSAVADQYPRLTLIGDAGWDSIHPGTLTDAASRYWNLSPQLTLPLFAGGRLRAGVEASEAGRRAALQSYRSTVLKALADAESAIVRYASEQQRSSALAAASARLANAAQLEERRFAAGDASRIEVLTAQRAADQARDALLVSQALLVEDYVALAKSLGGGWQVADARGAR